MDRALTVGPGRLEQVRQWLDDDLQALTDDDLRWLLDMGWQPPPPEWRPDPAIMDRCWR